jgi:hypothetical protein
MPTDMPSPSPSKEPANQFKEWPGFCVDENDDWYTYARLTRAEEFNTETVDDCVAVCLEYDTTWLRTVEFKTRQCYCGYESTIPPPIVNHPAYNTFRTHPGRGAVAGGDNSTGDGEGCYEYLQRVPGDICQRNDDCTTNICTDDVCADKQVVAENPDFKLWPGYCIAANWYYYSYVLLLRMPEEGTGTHGECIAACLQYDDTWLRAVELDSTLCFCSYESPDDATRIPTGFEELASYEETGVQPGVGPVLSGDFNGGDGETCYEYLKNPPGYNCTENVDCTTDYCSDSTCAIDIILIGF